LALGLLGFVLVAVPKPALADTPTASVGQALTISPPLLQMSANPGQTVTATLTLINISKNPLVMTPQANDFGASGEGGDPNIIFNNDANNPYSLYSWIQLPAPFTLQAQQSKTLNIPIVVPANGSPGGHYAVIRFTGSSTSQSGNNVALSASIGSLVLLSVSGNIQTKADVASFYAANSKFAQSSFFQQGPINFVTRIQDTGNIQVQPTGTITLTDMVGRQIADMRVNGDPSDPMNQPRNVLPASIRRFENTLSKKTLFGHYTAKLNLTYGQDKNKPLTLYAVASFWVIPFKLISAILLIVIVIFLALLFGLKQYKKRILKTLDSNKHKQKK
jgi:hypothetical protein